jgi:SAM-dependent methyltransferase
VALAERGIRVTAVDRTSSYLERARETARKQNVEVEWIRSDMREFVRPQAFDLAISMFTSFGYFDRAEDDRRVLENIHESLRPGGVLVMDLAGKEIVAGRFAATRHTLAPDGVLLVEVRSVLDGWERMENEWILIRDAKARSFHFSHTIYSGAEIRRLALEAGFDPVRIFGDLEGAPYGREAKRLVVVARRRGFDDTAGLKA